MTKDIKQIQEENRRLILEAIYGVSYEEALEKELVEGSSIEYVKFIGREEFCEPELVKNHSIILNARSDGHYEIHNKYGYDHYISREKIVKIIGKPITLSRVLLAIKNGMRDIAAYDIYWENDDNIAFGYVDRDSQEEAEIIWDLTRETLEEQSEETQRKIHQLLGGKDE